MPKIPVNKFEPEKGKIHFWGFWDEKDLLDEDLDPEEDGGSCWLEIPLKPFDSGLDYEPQPTKTSIRFDRISLPVLIIGDVAGKKFQYGMDECDGSIYLGSAHNPIDINWMCLSKIDEQHYAFEAELFFAFSHEGVGNDETRKLSTILEITADHC